jgi:hypothetical protein
VAASWLGEVSMRENMKDESCKMCGGSHDRRLWGPWPGPGIRLWAQELNSVCVVEYITPGDEESEQAYI